MRALRITAAAWLVLCSTPAAAGALAHTAAEAPTVLFLNRCVGGCAIEPGEDDARTHHSSVVHGSSVLSEWAHGDEAWDAVVQCVRETYAPYDIVVTDVDPGDADHLEAIVAGTWQEAGQPSAVCGVAPWQCAATTNVISFSFANSCYGGPEYVCATVSQESGHAFGLQHALDCADPMTYLPRCGRQFFRDAAAPCGLYESAPCSCGLTEQSSHRRLMEVLGPSPVPLPGPDIDILTPQDGGQVAEIGPFSIAADATHMRGIDHVGFYLNGELYGTVEGHPYNVDLPYDLWTPANLPPGVVDVEVRAYDDLGTESTATVTVTRGEPCAGDDDCLPSQACDRGRCLFPSSRGELGDPCTVGLECSSGLCPSDSSGGRCADWCVPSELDACPDGFACAPVRDRAESVCWPIATEAGCGCVAGAAPRRRSPVALWPLLAVVLLGAARRAGAAAGGHRGG